MYVCTHTHTHKHTHKHTHTHTHTHTRTHTHTHTHIHTQVDGVRCQAWYNACTKEWPVAWRVGDVIGFACDLTDKRQIHVSVNGSFESPNGLMFQLDSDDVRNGLFAAITGKGGGVRYNLRSASFRHEPPAPDYRAWIDFGVQGQESGRGGFHLCLGKASENLQQVGRSALDLVSAVAKDPTSSGISRDIVPFLENCLVRANESLVPLLAPCLKAVDDRQVRGMLLDRESITASDKVLLHMMSKEPKQFWEHLLFACQDRIPFLQDLVRVAMSMDGEKAILKAFRMCLFHMVEWLVARWHPLSSEGEVTKASAVDSLVHEASATVVGEFVQALTRLLEAAEREGSTQRSQYLTNVLTSGGMCEVLRMLSVLGYSIAAAEQHSIKVDERLLGWIASAASLLDRAISAAEDESVKMRLWPCCEMLVAGVGQSMSEMIWSKQAAPLLEQHDVLFAGSRKLMSAPAFEHLLSRDSKVTPKP